MLSKQVSALFTHCWVSGVFIYSTIILNRYNCGSSTYFISLWFVFIQDWWAYHMTSQINPLNKSEEYCQTHHFFSHGHPPIGTIMIHPLFSGTLLDNKSQAEDWHRSYSTATVSHTWHLAKMPWVAWDARVKFVCGHVWRKAGKW